VFFLNEESPKGIFDFDKTHGPRDFNEKLRKDFLPGQLKKNTENQRSNPSIGTNLKWTVFYQKKCVATFSISVISFLFQKHTVRLSTE